ncbi:trichohyalin-like [Anolis carolinensis]|uniref:trichohyalin-like n=1 Tax=Anolis carolinensis TaxID=28377 RepID=UPI002F2B3E31
MEASKENNNETQIAEAKLSPAGSTSQKDQAMARKVVKQEALKQIYIHRVLDHYSNLQRKACPEEVLQALEPFCTGEKVARDVVQSVEKQQVERAVAFLQKQSQEEEDLSASCSEKDEAKLRKLQALIRMELQTQIEEKVVGQLQLPEMKLEAKETEIVLEAMKHNTSLSAHFIVCFLLSRRHLRQAVLVLEANLELQETGLKTQGDGSSVEDLALDDPLVDQNTKAVVHLLKEKKDYVYSVLQLLQASQMLQLRERQFQEMVQKLKAHSSDQHLEEADQMVRELQEFRQRKTKELEENLRTSLKSPRTQEGRSKNPNDLQSERPLLEKDHKREGKERWQSFQQTWLVELEETYRGQISEEKARLQDQLEKGELKKWSKQNLLREHDETVTFLDKVFQQEMHKRRERMEKERRRRSHPQDGDPPASGSPQERQQPNLVEEDKVFSLLTEYVKILKQTELLVMLRLFLLNPRFRPLLSDGSEADGKPSSQILALLNEVNCQIRKCASAAGLLENQHEEYDKGTSFRDIMDIQMIPKSGESLVPLVPSSLSTKEFVIYQYGIVVLRFLRPLIGGPEIDLRLASSIPLSNAPGNAFQHTFYYQPSGHKLFVLRQCLGCVGSFLLLLVHCLAHIAANDLGHDSNPAFRRLFHQALKACLGELFFLRLRASSFSEDGKSAARMINEAFLKREGVADEKRNLSSGLSDGKAKPSADSEEVIYLKKGEGISQRTMHEDQLLHQPKALGLEEDSLPKENART